MKALRLDPKRHRPLDTPVAELFRERTGDPTFMTYWHCEHRHFVLAQWVGPEHVQEYPLFFRSCAHVTPEQVAHVLRLTGPAQLRRLRAEGKYSALLPRRTGAQMVDEQREREDYRRWARRKVGSHRGDHPLYRII